MSRESCITCSRWNFNAGQSDYSELTPGESWVMTCSAQHFYMKGHSITRDEMRRNLLKAKDCPDYTTRPDVNLVW